MRGEAMEVRDASPGYAPQVDMPVVPEGYKRTEVGVIPEEWNVWRVGEISTKVGSGVTPKGGNRVYKASGRPFVRSQNVGWGHLDLDDIAYIDESTHAAFEGTEIEDRDVLLNITGASIGRAAIADKRIAGGNVNQHVCIIRADRSVLVSDFLGAFLISSDGQRQIDSFQAGGNRQGLNFSQVRSIRLAMPGSIDEQRAIATALSDVDALLEALDRLIAKKRDIKQATMQQLLTAQTRLPGSEGEWETKQLKELAELSAGINKPLSEMGSGVLYVTVQDLYDGTSIKASKLSRIKVSQVEIDSKCLAVGDIVFGKSSVKREGIGYPSQFLGCDEPVVFSGFTYRARAYPKIADATFLFYALRAEQTRRWLIDNSQASALTNINQQIADSIPVRVPPTVNEQVAITTILSDIDIELEALQQRRAKTAALKQSMMQELLTGRTRLVEIVPMERAND